MGRDNLFTELPVYPGCTLYCELTAFYIDIELLSSDCMVQLQCRGGLTGIGILAVTIPVAHLMKRPSFGSIRIEFHRAEVFVEPYLAMVEIERKMITISRKS
jgi:hypothetical protein